MLIKNCVRSVEYVYINEYILNDASPRLSVLNTFSDYIQSQDDGRCFSAHGRPEVILVFWKPVSERCLKRVSIRVMSRDVRTYLNVKSYRRKKN